MQIIRGILLLKDGVASWVDQFGNSAADPALTIAVSTKIVLDIRQPLERSASTSVDAVLPAYPIAQLASTGLYFAMDSDYDQETIPKLIRTSDISVSTTDDGTTQVDFEVPNTDIEALHTALNNGASVSFGCELGGVNANNKTVFVIQFNLGLRNRRYIPGDSPDTPDPEDPAWLPAIRAIIAAEVAAAALHGTPGTPSYTYVAYASDADGTDFSLAPSGELEYRAEFVSSTLISEPDLDDFIAAAAVFVRYIVPGAAGASSKLYVAYATADDGSGFSLTPGADKPYRAEFISSNLDLTPVLADFGGATWVKYLGADGIDGYGVSPQGAWSAGNSPYDLHDMVTTAYGWFLSLIDNNNAAPPVPPATSDSWQLIVANGRNGYNVIRAYNTAPDADDTGWHTTQMADDLYYRDSMNGGVTWTAAVALSQAAVLPIARFAATYVEADADWWAPVAEPGVEFATARCAYFRFKLAGGSFSPESLIIQLEGDPTPEEVTAAENLLLSADLSIQYSATSAEDGDWHGALAAGDRCVRLYNAAGTVRVVWNLGGTAGVDIAAFEVAVGAGIAWHDIPQVADRYMKISVDGGATWGGVFRINAESVYDIWLAQGNEGTEADFLASLQGHITTVEAAIASFVADSGDDDDDATTAYKLALPGYIVGIRAYADDAATVPDRYDTKITYDADTDESTVWLSEAERDYFAALTGGKALLYIDTAEAMTSGGAFPLRAVTALPATPISGQMIRLTTADDTAKAAPGIYTHDGVGWSCVSYESAYALGNLGATPSLTLIPGASYTATVDAEITTFTVAFTRPGLCSITLTNASTLAVAQPEMDGRTSKLLAEGAWDGAATALSKALMEDDGTYIIASAGGLA